MALSILFHHQIWQKQEPVDIIYVPFFSSCQQSLMSRRESMRRGSTGKDALLAATFVEEGSGRVGGFSTKELRLAYCQAAWFLVKLYEVHSRLVTASSSSAK